jgi:hypothetical protein
VVQFNETENGPLNDLLVDFRRKVLIPITLNQAQQRLIFREENRNLLQNDPIIIKLGNEQIRLEHINPRSGMPDTRKTLFTAMDMAESDADWDNVLTLIEGLREHRNIRDVWLARLIRRAAERDMTHRIFQGFRRAADTGLVFRRDSLATDAFRAAIHHKGVRGGWDAPSTAKALSYAEQMLLMMERPPHRRGTPGTRDPWTIATALEPAAVQAARHRDGVDADGKVALYARRLVARLAELQQDAAARNRPIWYQTLLPADLASRPLNEQRGHLREFLEFRVLPMYHGLALALKVLGKDMPQRKLAEAFVQELHGVCSQAMKQFRKTFGDKVDETHALNQSWELVKRHTGKRS